MKQLKRQWLVFSKVLGVSLVLGFFCAGGEALAQTVGGAGGVERPPQFVLLAFDGSSSIPMWQETRRFAAEAKRAGKPVKFTYFISGVYYIGSADRRKYFEPTRGSGVSAIGWGGGASDLLARYDETNLAATEEHEIASHANAHFSGDKWGMSEWQKEFRQFHEIIFDFFRFNNLNPTPRFPNGWVFPEESMKGFRAPQLGVSRGLWDVLRDFGYRYDTSLVEKSDYWPQKHPQGGHWNFPLASLRIAGTGKRTLSMDYNFYVADSGAKADPANRALYQRRMLETYLQYFESNYNGNRAPIHIGHHFSKWNGGAYWEAMKEFALAVCGRSEVKCVTYAELADFMDSLEPGAIQKLQRGEFQKNVPIRLSQGMPTYDIEMQIAMDTDALDSSSTTRLGYKPPVAYNLVSTPQYSVHLRGGDSGLGNGAYVELRVNGELVEVQEGLSRSSQGLSRNLNRTWNRTWRRQFLGETVEFEARFMKARFTKTTGEYQEAVELARATHTIYNVGLPSEFISREPFEARALLGDLNEAHADHGH